MKNLEENPFSAEEISRYQRHLSLPEIGLEGQLRLKKARVLVVGAGGLGSPALLYLAAGGVGTIGIVDGDAVDLSNLQRQIVHRTESANRSKAQSARDTLLALNPHVNVELHECFLTQDNAAEIISGYDFVIDAVDSYEVKILIATVCAAERKPYCHGALSQYQGQLMTCVPDTVGYETLFDEAPEKETPKGPFGFVPAVIGSLQAAEAVKYITGIGSLLTDKMLIVDVLTMKFTTVALV